MVNMVIDTFMAEGTPMAKMAEMMGSVMNSFMTEMSGAKNPLSPTEFAYTMGEMVKSFMVGVTGDKINPAHSMGMMMGSMMESFMPSAMGDGALLSGSIEQVKHEVYKVITENMEVLTNAISQSFFALGDQMGEAVSHMRSMMMDATQRLGSMANFTEDFQNAFESLSNDILQMGGRMGEMVDKIDKTMVLQNENVAITQQNLESLITSLKGLNGLNEVGSSSLATTITNLEGAQKVFEETLSLSHTPYTFMNTELSLLGQNIDLDLSSVIALHSDISEIDISGKGENALNIDIQDLLSLKTTQPLFITGGSDDMVNIATTWVKTSQTFVKEGESYTLFTMISNQEYQLYIDTHLTLTHQVM
jgi:hypothetical protein